MKVSVVDLGFNSVKLVNYNVGHDGNFKAYSQEGVKVRLGEGLHESGHIGDDGAQRTIDARLTAAVPVASLSSGFRRSLQQKLNYPLVPSWPESLPDVAHLAGCGFAIILLLLVMPQHSRTVLLAGAGFTAVTYFLQAVLRSSLENLEHIS